MATKKMDKVKIAFVGCGPMIKNLHGPSLKECKDVELVGCCDLNEERVNEVGKEFGIEKRFTMYQEMLEKTNPDAVYIVMPPHNLYDIVVHCIMEGRHVFIDKPPGITTCQTRGLSKLAKKYGCKTMVGFNRRFYPLMRRCREIVEERGPIIQCVATFYKNHFGQSLYYHGAIDVLTFDAIHAVDTLRWMGGEVEHVASDINKFYMDFDNSFNALLTFKNGASGILLTNWAVGGKIHTFEMHGKGISAFIYPNTGSPSPAISSDRAHIFKDSRAPEVITTQELIGGDEGIKVSGFYQENRYFIDCLKEDHEPETCFEDAVKTMELVDSIYKSTLR